MVVDLAFIAVFALIYPVAGFFSFRRLLRRIDAGERISRWRLYNATLAGHWLLFAIAMVIWTVEGRSFELLGFGRTTDAGLGFVIAAAITAAATVALIAQLRSAQRADAVLLDAFRRSFGPVVHILPHTRRELLGFSGVAITAGIVEETLWRGYLIWFLTGFLPLWVAALISAVGFGIAHAYQGQESIPKITIVGLVLTGVYVLSGSLWLPILLHAAIDLLQGRMAYTVITRHGAQSPAGSG